METNKMRLRKFVEILSLLLQYVKYTFIAIFLLALCLGSLELSWCGAKSNYCWGGHSKVFQGESRTTFMLYFQVVCMCDYLDKVIVKFVSGWQQNVAKNGHVLNLVVWTAGIIYAVRIVIHKLHMPHFTI